MSLETTHPHLAFEQPARQNKIVTAAESARLVMDGDTISSGRHARGATMP